MRVPYHIGPQNDYSLAFVGETQAALQNWQDSESTWCLRYIEAPDGDQLALAYTPSQGRPSENDANVSEWSEGTATLAYAYLSAFTGVSSGASVTANKSFDAEKVERALERVEWRQTVPEVAGELWSNLVLAHPLPNANHRSALALVSLYLRSQDSRATLGSHVQEVPEVTEIVDEFFATSKRLLTVRRNARQFGILANHGVREVERKGNVRISLDEFDFDVNNPYRTYAHEHLTATVEFIEAYLLDTGLDELTMTEDKGKSAFVQALRRMELA